MSSGRKSKSSSRSSRTDRGESRRSGSGRNPSTPRDREERERGRSSRSTVEDSGGSSRRDRDGRGENGASSSRSGRTAMASIPTPLGIPDHHHELARAMHSGGGAKSPTEHSVASSRIADDAVQLDLPMADLMAYLQVVANNSSNLPLTRRDDPELGRTVSSLTSEEYAFKCAAFVPASVRIIGGQFGRYGRVWDLPTSEVSFGVGKCKDGIGNDDDCRHWKWIH